MTPFPLSSHSGRPCSRRSTASRRRRHRCAQVRRACDFCRLTRAKCDSQLPCRNCQHKGRNCMITTSDRRGRAPLVAQMRTRTTEPAGEAAATAGQLPLAPLAPRWKGLRVGDVYYGPSSMAYFRSRLYAFLAAMLRRPQPDVACQLRVLGRPSATLAGLPPEAMPRTQEDYYLGLWWLRDFRTHCDSLWVGVGPSERSVRRSSALVDVVLALCMQFSSAYTAAPGVSAARPGRTGSQDGASTDPIPPGYEELAETPSLTTVQCGLLGAQYLDNCGLPSSAHSHVAAALRTAVSLGMHCSYVAVAVDQHDVSRSATELQQVLAGRLWASLTAMDADLSVRLGRPMLVVGLGLGLHMVMSMGRDQDTVLLGRPTSFPRLARLLDATYVMPAVEDGDGLEGEGSRDLEGDLEGLDDFPHSTTWLAYHDQCTRLIHLVGTIHADFYRHCEHLFRQHVASATSSSLHTDPSIREAAARFLVSRTSALYAWAGAVPRHLLARRSRLPGHNCARPFDTTSTASPLDLCPHRDPATPLWLHRQRLVLELRFHAAIVLLFQPFIAFSPAPMTNTPTADSLPIAAVRHAVTIGYIARQALAHTACLQAATASANVACWLHDAALVMVGFTASYPVCPPSALARRAIEPTLEALAMCGAGEGLGLGLGLDAEVAELRRVARAADDILGGFGGRRTGPERPADVPATPAGCLAAPAAGEPVELLVTELQGSVYADLDPVGNAEFWTGFMQELDTPVQNFVPG